MLHVQRMKCLFLIQGFEGTLVWENLDSAGLSTVNSSSVQLSDGGGVLKISSVRTDVVSKINVQRMFSQHLKCKNSWRSQKTLLFPFICRSQRAYCRIEARSDFPVWLAGSHLLSMVGPGTELILSFFIKTVRSESLHEPTLQGVPVPM